MTSKHLPPDTAAEISALKRRTSDLERALERVRGAIPTVPTNFNTPFASIEADAPTTVPAGTPVTLLPQAARVPDPTGHIHLEHLAGTFTYIVPGFYEIGGTVEFTETAGDGQRSIAVIATDSDDIASAPLLVHTVDRAPDVDTVLSGSRMIYVTQATVIRWHLAAGHAAGADLDVWARSFWTRFVTTGDPPPTGGA